MKKDNLEMGLDKLLTYLDDPDRHRDALEMGLAHLQKCPDYESRVETLIQDVLEPGLALPVNLLEMASKILVRWQKNLEGLEIEFWPNPVLALQLALFSPSPAPSFRKGPQPALWEFSLRDRVEDLRLEIVAREQSQDPTYCTITVAVQILSRGPLNYADTEVTLRHEEEILKTEVTNALGTVSFKDVPADALAQLVLEITPSQQAR